MKIEWANITVIWTDTLAHTATVYSFRICCAKDFTIQPNLFVSFSTLAAVVCWESQLGPSFSSTSLSMSSTRWFLFYFRMEVRAWHCFVPCVGEVSVVRCNPYGNDTTQRNLNALCTTKKAQSDETETNRKNPPFLLLPLPLSSSLSFVFVETMPSIYICS